MFPVRISLSPHLDACFLHLKLFEHSQHINQEILPPHIRSLRNFSRLMQAHWASIRYERRRRRRQHPSTSTLVLRTYGVHGTEESCVKVRIRQTLQGASSNFDLGKNQLWYSFGEGKRMRVAIDRTKGQSSENQRNTRLQGSRFDNTSQSIRSALYNIVD
jgi:hypothetical protein